MHSIAPVRSSGGAAAYFANDNYYTQSEHAECGVWGGEGAHLLGLEGAVGREAFEAVLGGQLPSGEKVGQVEGRRLGIDMTFSMPKSASILALVTGDTRILDANLRAVRSTMKQVEARYAEARSYERNRNGEAVRTGNLVYALFAHDTSRALDPQAHIHAVVANVTRMANGEWRALWNGAIWKANTVIGQIYHAALRAELGKIGYQTEAAGKHGAFEICGVPKPVREAFSKRTAEIEAKIAETGATRLATKKAITLYTRDPKLDGTDHAALQAEWRERAAAMGFDGRALVADAQAHAANQRRGGLVEGLGAVLADVKARLGQAFRPGDPMVTRGSTALFLSPATLRAEHATASAIRHLSEREAAFATDDILRAALGFQIKGLEGEGVAVRIEQLIASGQLIPEQSNRLDGAIALVTTPQVLAREQAILDKMDTGRGEARVLLGAEQAATRLQAAAGTLGQERAGASDWALNGGQLAAGVMILAGDDRFANIQGVAGAGKSTLIGAVDKVLRDQGVRLIGLAFQNRMVADLRGGGSSAMSVEEMQASGIEAYTIASFANRYGPAAASGSGPRYDAARAELAGTMLITDESSMVSSKDMLRIIDIATRLGVEKAIFIGDRQQLSAIEQGKMFAVAQAHGLPTARMDENLRQQRSPLLSAVAGLSNDGFASVALDLLAAHGRVTEAPGGHIKAAADRWLGLSDAERAQTAIFTAGRDDRAAINALVQEGLKAEGKLTGEGVKLTTLQSANTTREELRHASTWAPGMVLEARLAIRELGLARGLYDVTRIDAKGRVTLKPTLGKPVRIDPQKLDPLNRYDRMSLLEKRELRVHGCDTIIWRDKDAARDIAKSTYAKVVSADAKAVTVELADKKQLVLPMGDPMLKRLDLGYALNAHMAQGMTTPKAIEVIASAQRNLATQRTQNVLNTRATDDLRVVTDDFAGLKAQLDRNPGNKTSALETVGALEVDRKVPDPVDRRAVPEPVMSPALKAKLEAVPPPVRELPLPVKQLDLGLG